VTTIHAEDLELSVCRALNLVESPLGQRILTATWDLRPGRCNSHRWSGPEKPVMPRWRFRKRNGGLAGAA
jgi:hypothetical protein